MKNATREPQRTCIGCRRRAVASALARVALSDGTMVFWGTSARPAGRGASLHPNAECLRAALKTGAFARAFRARVDRSGISDEANLLEQLIQRRWYRKTP